MFIYGGCTSVNYVERHTNTILCEAIRLLLKYSVNCARLPVGKPLHKIYVSMVRIIRIEKNK